ncbi:MAG TPA: DUF1579 domain-containing protein [Phycisphaerae bacterium]
MKSRLVLGGWVTVCALALATGRSLAQEKKGEEKPPAKPPAGKEGPKKEAGKEDPHGQMPSPEDMAKMKAMYIEAAKPVKEHEVLKQLEGRWKSEAKAYWEDPQHPEITSGTVENRLILGGRFLLSDQQGTAMGMPFEGHWMIGFDKQKKKYVTVWVDNMGTGLFPADGTADADGKVLTFTGSWPDPVMPMTHDTRMVTTIVSPSKYTFEMYEKGPDGKEMKVMEVTYTK